MQKYPKSKIFKLMKSYRNRNNMLRLIMQNHNINTLRSVVRRKLASAKRKEKEMLSGETKKLKVRTNKFRKDT